MPSQHDATVRSPIRKHISQSPAVDLRAWLAATPMGTAPTVATMITTLDSTCAVAIDPRDGMAIVLALTIGTGTTIFVLDRDIDCWVSSINQVRVPPEFAGDQGNFLGERSPLFARRGLFR